MMSNQADHHAQQAPELVAHSYPEALSQGHQQQYNQYSHYPPTPPIPPPKQEGSYVSYMSQQSVPNSAYTPSHHTTPQTYHSQLAGAGAAPMSDGGGLEKRRGAGAGAGRMICGCTAVVFFLTSLVVLLAAAVVGLAAGTGIEASRATSAQNRADRLNASLVAALAGATATTKSSTSTASASATSSSTSFASLDDNCSGNPDGVTGTTYSAFSLLGDYSFTIQCNKDTDGSPLMSLFTADLNACMDACAAYSHYTPSMFGNNTNTTCAAVSFIPLWTNETAALTGGAPGNCYLKPTQTAAPTTPNIGTECHAGILVTS